MSKEYCGIFWKDNGLSRIFQNIKFLVNNLLFLVYDIIEFAGRILNVPQCYIRATNFHKDNLWVLLLLRSQNLSYWNLNLFLDYFVIFDSGLGHSAILKQTLILGIRN